MSNMIPIKRYVKTPDGNRRLVLTTDPFGMILNTYALGDAIAAAPVIKYLLDNFYVTPESHVVVLPKPFHLFYPFVSSNNLRDFADKSQPLWGIPDHFPLAILNKKSDGRFVRNTPKHMHLSHYASFHFADRIIPLDQLEYVPTPKIDVSHFNIDFRKSVVLVVTYRDHTRRWPAEEVLKVATWLQQQGITPVFVGKTEKDDFIDKEELIAKSSLPDNIDEYGVDLRNKTSLEELVTIMDQSIAVCGVDSGPIHVAGTTQTPIICGYPTAAAEHRVPTRKSGNIYPLLPLIECGNCESSWKTIYHNYEKCFFGHADCCKTFTAERYIEVLKTLLT